MKKMWILPGLFAWLAYADSPKIDLPPQPPAETTAQVEAPAPPEQPISTSETDPNDKNWKEYDNRIVRIHVRVKSAWTAMELKESAQVGTASFTLSRLPLVTFAVVREPLQGDFDAYVSSAALTPLYPSGYREYHTVFAGRKAVRIHGTASDGRQDESYFLVAGRSLYRVSFSAPKDYWKEAETDFGGLKESFRWLP
jgi:hypothetical protein